MSQTQFISANQIYESYKKPTLGVDSLYLKISSLINNICHILPNKDIDEASKQFLKACYELRIELFKAGLLTDFSTTVNTSISTQFTTNHFRDEDSLSIRFQHVIEFLNSYYTATLTGIEASIDEDAEKNRQSFPSFDETKNLLSSISNNSYLFFIEGLYLEFYLIVVKLDFEGELKLSEKKREIVSERLFSHTEEFAYYSTKIGVWTPLDDDECKITRNIKIRLASEEEVKNTYSFDELKRMFV